MGEYLAKLGTDRYVEWTTVYNAPITYVCTRLAAVFEWGEERVARADCNGTSICDDYPAGHTPEEIVRNNHAGPSGRELTLAELLVAYDPDDPAPWINPDHRVIRAGDAVRTLDGPAWPVPIPSGASPRVMPLAEDKVLPATQTQPERVVFADGSRVSRYYPEWGVVQVGTTYGSSRDCLQGVLWDDGEAAICGVEALTRQSAPRQPSARDAAQLAEAVEHLAWHFLARTRPREGHPAPDDHMLGRRFADCLIPPPFAMYPRIRAEVLRILAERAAQSIPGAPTVMVEYHPHSGPILRVPLAVGNRLMKNALSDHCGAIVWVTAIEETTYRNENGTWVTVEDADGRSVHWRAGESPRRFFKID